MSKEEVKFTKENHSMTFSILLTSSELGQQKCLIYFFNHIEPDPVLPKEHQSLSIGLELSMAFIGLENIHSACSVSPPH